MILQITLIIAGFILLIKGADWLVSGATAMAKKHHVSDLAIGLTIVAFGTSAPELVVNVVSSFQGHQDIVFGNIIGSNNFNLFIILGIAGLITPLAVSSGTVWKEIPMSLLAAVLLFVFANDFQASGVHILSRADGMLLLLMFFLFLWYVYSQLRLTPGEENSDKKPSLSGWKVTALIIIGLAGLIAGGRMVVTSAVEIAKAFGISEKVIALTIVAAGTSLPELATSVVAALKKNNDIAVGNVIGSNIFNIFLILGLSSTIHPVTYELSFNTDLYLLGFGTLLLFTAMFTGKKKRLDRWEAGLLLIVYILYTVFLLTSSTG